MILSEKADLTEVAVSVIVVSYNTRQMTLDCLQTLFSDLEDVPAEVIVVDNASTDGSISAIRETFPQVTLIENDRNVGFGAANNQAMQQAKGEFFLLLNSDAFPKPGAIKVLIAYLREHPEVGVVGPKLLNADGSRQLSCYRYPSPALAWRENLWISAVLPSHPVLGDYRHWAHDHDRIVEWIIGACLLVRRATYEQVGGFDEKFFMYAEETDWQLRMQQQGWQIAFTSAAQVTHLAGASGHKEKPKINRHFFDSYDFYVEKHHGKLGLFSMRMAMVLGCGIRTVLWGMLTLLPQKRAVARAKARTQAWLCVRQATHWKRQVAL